MFQRTIKQKISTTGIGLHTGEKSTLTLRPASENIGIIYRRIDLNPPIDILLEEASVQNSTLCTCIKNQNNIHILTIEHLNAALSGLGIDNIIIEVDSQEIPILDGSAAPFLFLLLKSGVKKLKSKKVFLQIKKKIRVTQQDKWAELSPYDGFKLNFTIDFNHPIISNKTKKFKINVSSKSFSKYISRARTFGFIQDIKYLKLNKLCLGGGLESAIIIGDTKIINKDGLRFKNELVRHKTLDAIGDLFMCGKNLIGSFVAYKSGHKLNNKLLKTVLKKTSSWKLITFNDKSKVPIKFSLNFFKKIQKSLTYKNYLLYNKNS